MTGAIVSGGTPAAIDRTRFSTSPRRRSRSVVNRTDRAEILADYPYLEADDITAVLEFAALASSALSGRVRVHRGPVSSA
ncbi:MAG: DUF433 domain-containing protein [Vicinamibacterales bacterium]